MMHMQQMT